MTPTIASVEVVPVAGYDSMLLNLSGAHGPFFTRNVVILTDSSGNTGAIRFPSSPDEAAPLFDEPPAESGDGEGGSEPSENG